MALRDDVIEYFPSFAWAVENPALAAFLEKAVQSASSGDGGWDDAKFMSELQQTEWWKKTEPAVREFQQRSATDPSAIDQRLREREAKLWDQSQSLGLNLNADVIRNQARNAEQFGLSDNQILDSLVGQARAAGYQGAQGNLGAISTNIAALKTAASNYYTNIDDKTAFDYATQIAQGERAIGDFNALFKDQAKARFSYSPQLVQQIDQGFTPEQLFQPQKNMIAQLLEVDPSQINLNDSKWNQVLDYADGSGQRRSATIGETAKLVRQSADWQKTANGQAAGADFKARLTQMFQGR